MKHIKIIFLILTSVLLFSGTSCKKYLDEAFPNPNKPVAVDPDLVMPAVISNVARGIMFDSRFLGNYISYWHRTATGITWERMGYDPGSDNGGEKWRTHYWNLGLNLLNAINDGRNTNRPEYAGAGWALFAFSWLQLADYHGDVILDEAFKSEQLTFKYNTQDQVYDHVKVLCDSAIYYFNQVSSASDGFATKGDKYFYAGNIDRWKKFVYGVKALVYHRYINKSTYSADSVIKYADLSFASAADDAIIKFDASLAPISTNALNFYGPTRQNVHTYRASKYLIDMMNGTSFFRNSNPLDTTIDPRRAYIFRPDSNENFSGLAANVGISTFTRTTPWNFYGFNNSAVVAGGVDTGARTFFKNASPFPILTYGWIQFVKAEAAFKKGDMNTAKTAYIAGINGSFDLLTGSNFTGYTPITPTARNLYINDPNVNPTTLTLSHIMLQKFVSLWPYGMEEIWVDLRKYQYNPAIFVNYVPVASLYPDNGGKLVQRVRPRYNSEYLWNVAELQKIGAIALDYHTVPVWFTKP
ncbi:MAG TPA: SusD/RagB family nutrient-binding outer membrane lipoprotein [Flavitalea sp.]|nr:SusD/RagB family nutrient-binding outer membrane lipoprotein [Flavitalea sp.]